MRGCVACRRRPGLDGLGGEPGVRGCVTCRRRPGPSKSRRNITPGHHPSPQGLRPDGPRTPEVEETSMDRRGFSTERHDVPGSAVGKDSDEALHSIVQICRLHRRVFKPQQWRIRRGSNGRSLPRANTEPRLCVLLCPVSPSPDLAVLASSLGELTANVLMLLKSSASQESNFGPLLQSVTDRPESNLNHKRVQA